MLIDIRIKHWTVIRIVIGGLSTVINGFMKELKDLEIRERVKIIQISALLKSARILRRVLESCCHSDSCRKPAANAGVKNSQMSKILSIQTEKSNYGLDWQQKAYDNVPNELILKILNILKISPVIITFLKYHMQRWHTNLGLIHEKLIIWALIMEYSKETHFLLFFFCIALILLSIELKTTANGYKTTPKVNHLFYNNDSMLWAKMMAI